jgi:hypothetical protein
MLNSGDLISIEASLINRGEHSEIRPFIPQKHLVINIKQCKFYLEMIRTAIFSLI